MKLLTVILPVFALVFIGWTAQRLRLMEPSALRGLRDLVFFLAMPALLFSAIETAPPFDLVSVISVYFAAALSIFAFAFVVARLLGMSLAKAAMLSLNSSYGNTVLMGIPIIVAALGEDALPPLLAIIALHSAILLPLAGVLVEMDAAGSGRRRPLAILAATLGRTLRNPIIMSILVATLWRVSRLPVPAPLDELLRLLGSAATPLALICLGGVLPSLGALAPDAGALIGTVLKLVGLPALVWAIGRYAHLPDLPLKVAILVGGMPTGANAFLLARRDEGLAGASAAIVMATTLLSAISLAGWLQVVM
jgi:predicted permease